MASCRMSRGRAPPSEASEPREAHGRMATMAEGRILIADDEDGLRWVLEKGFRGAGYQVTAVKDGTSALREAEAQPFDLILLDIRMPGIDGLTLLGRIRGK